MYSNLGSKSGKNEGIKEITYFRQICFLLGFITLIVIITIIPIDIDSRLASSERFHSGKCYDRENDCNIQIVESIPEGLNFSKDSPKFMSTFAAWQLLLDVSNVSINIGSFYWTLRGSDVVEHESAYQGEKIFERILSNGRTQKIKIQIAQSMPSSVSQNKDTEIFAYNNAAEVRTVDIQRLLGGGVLHTKLWIVDDKHFYLGSANMDWRSLTQVKEVGVLAQNCSCLADDLSKIFQAYWYLGLNESVIPKKWPKAYTTKFNLRNPMKISFNNRYNMSTFFSSSPPPFLGDGRESDLDAIVNTILTAKKFVHIAVMDYMPLVEFTKNIRFWSNIDDAIRAAAINNKISIKMLVSWWHHSKPGENNFLRSLSSLANVLPGVDIQIKRFIVPINEDQQKIPFSRVNHNKYMVTDNTAYIGTSNWSGDYFIDTAGVGLILRDIGNKSETLRTDLVKLFQRDWDSPYAFDNIL